MNWNQTGMPSALVSRLGQKRELAEFKMVLKDAQNHVLQPVDVESMAEELVQADSSEKSVPPEDGLAEWEEWDRRFRALLG